MQNAENIMDKTILRDHRTGDMHDIDPITLDLMAAISGTVASRHPVEIISGYRSPQTNSALRGKSSGVAKKQLSYAGRGC